MEPTKRKAKDQKMEKATKRQMLYLLFLNPKLSGGEKN